MESHPVWVRGLKLDHREPCVKCYRVAPCVGAWIETFVLIGSISSKRSHPVWVRGLKQNLNDHTREVQKSHPVWVRGLKLGISKIGRVVDVAPRVGAWIETRKSCTKIVM